MRNRNQKGRSTHACGVCGMVCRSANKLMNHQMSTHRASTGRVRRPRASSRRMRGRMTGQIRQPSNNLPVPTTGTRRSKMNGSYGNSGIGVRGAITNRIDNLAIDAHFTSDGAAFVHRACHPNDETRGGGVFIPDDVTADRAVIEERPYGILAAPASIPTDGNWDLQVCVLSTSDIPYVYRTKPSTSTDWFAWQVGDSAAFVKPGAIQCASAVADGATTVLPTEQALPITENGAAVVPTLLRDTAQFRQAFAGITCIMNSSSLHDEGYVTAGQWGNKAKTVKAVPNVASFITDNFPMGFDDPRYEPSQVECLLYVGVPDSVRDIVAACPEFGQWEAKKGIYMPMRFDDPVHIFNGGAVNALATATGGGNVQTHVKVGYPLMLTGVGRLEERFARDAVFLDTTNPGRCVTSAGDVNQTFGCMIWSGLHKTTQIIVKMRVGLDLVPVPDSQFAASVQKGPLKDQLALDMATSIQSKLPVVYEHKYNSLGFLAGLVGKAAKMLLPTFAPWLGDQVSRGTTWLGNKIFGSGVPNV